MSAVTKLLESALQRSAQVRRIVLADDVRVASAAHLDEPILVGQKRFETLGELVRLEAREHLAAARSADQLLGTSARSDDRGQPGRERLGDDEPEPFLQRRQHEERRTAKR